MIIENITKNDFREINKLLLRNGLSTIEASSSLYSKFQSENDRGFPLGWKLLDPDNKIRGVLFSHITEYTIRDKRFFACTMSTWAVDEGYRGDNTQRLLEKCMSQKNIDLLIDGTATAPVAKRLLKSGYFEIHNSDFKEIFFWVTNYNNFFKFILSKYKISKKIFFVIRYIFLLLDYFKMEKNKINTDYEVEIVQTIPDNIYELFRNNINFCLKKDKYNIGRRIQNGLDKKKCSILLVKKENIIKGYAIIDFHLFRDIDVKKITIFDISALEDSEEIIDLIVKKIISYSNNNHCAFVEFYGVPKYIRKIILNNKAYKRKFRTSPFYIKVLNDKLLEMEEFKNWSPTLIDTDRSLY